MTLSASMMARIGSALYLFIIAVGAWEEMFVRGRIIVAGDPEATAANLRSMRGLWRLAIAGEVTLLVAATALTLILYLLLRPVNRELALLAVLFNLMCTAIEGSAAVSLATALSPAIGVSYAKAFDPTELGALSLLSMRGHTGGFSIALIFFGVECVLLGYLIYRSGYMPRAIGVLMAAAGLAYLVNSYAWILSPALQARLFPAVLLPPFLGELSFALWLAARGVREGPWNALPAERTILRFR